jgi:hypothetical protein
MSGDVGRYDMAGMFGELARSGAVFAGFMPDAIESFEDLNLAARRPQRAREGV